MTMRMGSSCILFTMRDDLPARRSGCATCFGDDAAAVWKNRNALAPAATIADESHFHVRLLRCQACDQLFASVFCETIDWAGGNDPQDSLLIPLTDAEGEEVAGAGADGVERALNALPEERRFLVRTFPRDAAHPEAFWIRRRIWLPRHD
jgi:hypothetical protein